MQRLILALLICVLCVSNGCGGGGSTNNNNNIVPSGNLPIAGEWGLLAQVPQILPVDWPQTTAVTIAADGTMAIPAVIRVDLGIGSVVLAKCAFQPDENSTLYAGGLFDANEVTYFYVQFVDYPAGAGDDLLVFTYPDGQPAPGGTTSGAYLVQAGVG